MKKVLILTYYWPPGSGPGVQRWLKFCKYLPEFGWQPEVITVQNGSFPSMDHSLLKEVPEHLTVHRTKTLEPFTLYNLLRGKSGKSIEVGMGNLKGKPSLFKRMSNFVRANLFIPDARVGWNAYVFSKAIKVIRNNPPDLIITTGPPHSTHLVGERLKKMFDLPWIVDMRDPWTTIYYNQLLSRTERTKRKDEALEDNVLKSADGVITASNGMVELFKSRAKKIQFIPNGFDQSDFENPPAIQPTKFVLGYTGNLKEVQNIESLWQCLAELNDKSQFRGKFLVEITGNVSESILDSIAQFRLQNIVTINAFVKHEEAIKKMYRANLLLLPIPKGKGNNQILTGKIFEYLATRRPILSIGPIKGDAAKLLKDCDKEPMFDYEDQSGIQAFLEQQLIDFISDPKTLETGNENHRAYSRKGTTSQLVTFIESIVS